MTDDKTIFDPEVVIPNTKKFLNWILGILKRRKKLIIILAVIILVLIAFRIFLARRYSPTIPKPQVIAVSVDKSFDFPALNNQGKATSSKIRLKIAQAEKTNQVIVKDQTFTAKNNKLFLIVNLELKNDATIPLNLLPGDLIRLTYNDDDNNKYAPDLHNNLVLISAISTKLDRVGFVIPDSALNFKLLIGELEGKKESIAVEF